MKPLLCIFAHPDDEAFGPSGSIAHFATLRDVHLLCITSGNADDKYTKLHTRKLGEIRKKELENSAKILGVKTVECLQYKDGSLCNNLYHELAKKIKEKIEKYNPDTLLTFEQRGCSGHLDHIAVSFVTTYVFKKVKSVKKLLYFVNPSAMDKFVRLLNYFIYFPPGYTKDEIDLTINIEPHWKTKVKAMRAHVSQKEDAHRMILMLRLLPKEEHFIVAEK